MSTDPTFTMDRTAIAIYKLGEEPPDRDYWLTRPVGERLAAGEELRTRAFGPHYDARQRLQRVCRIVRRA